MSAKHTPWSATSLDENGRDYEQPIAVIGSDGNYVAYHADSGTFLRPEHACLIAAAPELLDALTEFVTNHGTLTEWERRQKAFAAIAKATGAQP